MTVDRIENINGAVVQHGTLSDRAYLMHFDGARPQSTAGRLDKLAQENGYGKIIAKVPESAAREFIDQGFQQEAAIPGFYKGAETALFLVRYQNLSRACDRNRKKIHEILTLAGKHAGKGSIMRYDSGAVIRRCGPDDAENMSRIYQAVFPTYPFPITSPQYLIKTMQSHVAYFGAEYDHRLAALASSEMDSDNQNVEMTDFATLPQYRGRSLSVVLLKKMESAMQTRGMKTAYTIARAVSAGMNITFARAGYIYSGTLVNNTNISGNIESMNVWYKTL